MQKNKTPKRKDFVEVFGIPYATLNDWAKSGEDNWRFKLLDFLSNLTFDEIEIIKNRSKKIEE
ncbi:hypothetical protein HMPREF1019_01904 [Campylobacter sp. 10_1_50]|uniref:hypothetical protein n=1 Tax=Campylobacter TaxID=194 RepID=UPI000241050E|nr:MULTISPECIES: hypothetical protein [Campylobacter]EHL88021.1 hypothetical protein HMPREF1019_01904 [Campylobacter sp. 10_1_50]